MNDNLTSALIAAAAFTLSTAATILQAHAASSLTWAVTLRSFI
jgi:hypothetical protein